MVHINKSLCIGCGLCAKDCLAFRIKITEQKAVYSAPCIHCGHCVAICPTNAVSIPEYDMEDIEEYDPSTFELNPNTVLHAIKFRRSIRDYAPKPVETEKLNRIAQAGRYTATAKNNQGSHFIFVKDDIATLKKLVWNHIDELVNKKPTDIPEELTPFANFNARRKINPADDFLFRNAPVVVFITSDWPLDAGLAAQNMELMAIAQGLGTLYNGYLCRIADMNPGLKEWLGIESKTIKACMLLGYPNVSYKRTAPRARGNIIWR